MHKPTAARKSENGPASLHGMGNLASNFASWGVLNVRRVSEVGYLVLYARRVSHPFGADLASGRIGDNGTETMDLGPYECANCG